MDIEYERALDSEYGRRVAPVVWFMFDNHTFQRVTGTPDEMGRQILDLMEKDGHCGYVSTRAWRDGPLMPDLSLHGDYTDRDATWERVSAFVENMRALLGDR